MNLKIGDVVCLKSGGPTMVVKKINDVDVTCLWFNLNDELQKAKFIPQILVLKTEGNIKTMCEFCNKPIDDHGH